MGKINWFKTIKENISEDVIVKNRLNNKDESIYILVIYFLST